MEHSALRPSHTAYDAVVIGGGPGGAMSALVLARAGWRTLLVERGGPDRDKPCGRCLSPHAVGLLRRHGLGRVLVTSNVLANFEVVVEGRMRAAIRLAARSSDAAVVVHRAHFDRNLREAAAHAGAEVIHGCRASVVQPGSGATTVVLQCGGATLNVTAKFVVGADGLGSCVARALGLADRRSAGRAWGFACDLPALSAPPTGTVRMHLARAGYVGAVRSEDACHLAAFVRHNLSPQHVLDGAGFTSTTPERPLGAGPMPWRPHAVASAQAVLIGDAAGYEQPFTGEGMYWALRSAELLGDLLDGSAPGAWSLSHAEAYARSWRRSIGRAHRACRAVGRCVAHPRLASVVAKVLSCAPSTFHFASRHLAPAAC
jgi:menaquinone-9 beta-reductase